MDYLFDDLQKTKLMVYGAYKKLKSKLYYDKTLVFAKRDLASFESDRDTFINSLDLIAEKLNKADGLFFDEMINKISYRIMPKKFKSVAIRSDIVNSEIDHNEKIEKVNFFIDMPTELMIVDFLWTILIGKISQKSPELFTYAAATKFKSSLFNESEDLFDGIDYKSNRSFEPYFGLYTSWRDRAFSSIKKNYSDSDLMLLCLDLKSFYYSVEFDFSLLNEYLPDARLQSFSFLTGIIEKIYFAYTSKIVKCKKGILNQEHTCIFPIGVFSSYVLRELYLYKFDQQIVRSISPKYYNRYVDDILIVCPFDNVDGMKRDDVIKNLLIDTGLVKSKNESDSDFKFVGYNNIRIQKEKINCFSFKKGQKTLILDIYEEAIKSNSSEANLLPDTDILNSTFTQKAYQVDNLDLSSKIRDLGILHNNSFKATRFVNSLLRLIKNTKIQEGEMNEYLDQITDFYQGSQIIEFSSNWRAIFELLLLCEEHNRANELYLSIDEEIDKLSFDFLEKDEILEKPKKKLLKEIKTNLHEKLIIVTSLTASLNDSFIKAKKFKKWSEIFRRSNLLNHAMVSFPLLNYSRVDDVSLTETDISKLYKKSESVFTSDPFLLEWSPRYIHAAEFYLSEFLFYLGKKRSEESFDPRRVGEKYTFYNNLGNYAFNILDYKIERFDNVTNYKTFISGGKIGNPKIALVNTNVSKDTVKKSITNPNDLLSFGNKMKLYRIINTALEERVDFLVFPEYYFPISWIIDVALFAIKRNITIVTGIQFIKLSNRAYNNVCTIIPFVSGKSFNQGLIQFREKNFYAPEEKHELSKLSLICNNQNSPVYFSTSRDFFTYSSFLCYEFTDIISRAAMKNHIDILFAPQLNRDTNYFSSIVESTARDLFCFVVQSNTSHYGDSRITAPYITEKKNIIQVKGGDNDVVLVSEVKVHELINERTMYPAELNRIVSLCFKCSSYKKRRQECEGCKYKELPKKDIKGPPPNT